jgi:F0F1-type ATP synthase membrane subunit c/vacuolar-type H+-ATPase subunit K
MKKKLALLAAAALVGLAGLGAGHASPVAKKGPHPDAKSIEAL